MKRELTPLVADQHWTRCVAGTVVSLPIGKQVVPEHCRALQCTQTAGDSVRDKIVFKSKNDPQSNPQNDPFQIQII